MNLTPFRLASVSRLLSGKPFTDNPPIIMKNRLTFLVAILWLLFTLPSVGQKAENVRYQSVGNQLVITFDLVGVNKKVKTAIQPGLIVADQLPNYGVMKHISGDTGLVQSIDGPKVITWDLYKDIETLPSNFSIDIKVVAERRTPIQYVLAFSGSSLAPLGLKYERLGRWGYYVAARTLNFNFTGVDGVASTFDGFSYISSENPVQFTEARRQSFSFHAGVSRMVFNRCHAYLGTGLGIDRTIWKVENLDGDLNPTGQTFWVRTQSVLYSSSWALTLAETGVIVQLNKRMVMELGAGFLGRDASYGGLDPYFSFGLGFVFKSNSLK